MDGREEVGTADVGQEVGSGDQQVAANNCSSS